MITALGADIFAGLFTVGVRKAGFAVLAHLEHGNYGAKTCALNFPDLSVRVGRNTWNERDFRGKVDLMFCNPPCAAWSVLRRGGSWRQQSDRLQYIRDIVNAGIVVRPKAWCWESVVPAWKQGRSFVIEQAKRWLDAGWHTTVLLQDNQYLGVPQRRPRMFLIAHRHPLVWPRFTKPRTVQDVLTQCGASRDRGVPTPRVLSPLERALWRESAKFRGRLRQAYESMSPTDIERLLVKGGSRPGVTGRPLNAQRRLILDKPAPVMLGGSDKRYHPTEPRFVTWDECLAFVGLPRTWKTACGDNYAAATYELSRAVMPGVGEWIGRAVRDGFDRPLLPRRPQCRVVDLRNPDVMTDEELDTRSFEEAGTPPLADDVPPPQARQISTRASVSAPLRRLGSGHRIRCLLTDGRDVDTILEIIHREFPNSKATKSDVYWNRRKLANDGHP